MEETNDFPMLDLSALDALVPDISALRGPAWYDKEDSDRLSKLRAHLLGLQGTALGLDFTDKGRANICRRFGVSPDELALAVAWLSDPPRPGRPTPALLLIIGAAVGRAHATKG